jgi:hypothetical protein
MGTGWNPVSETTLAAADRIAGEALARVQETSGRVRVEDYLAVLAAVTGEAALIAAGLFDVESTALAPGSAVFGDEINVALTGDVAELDLVPPASVLGVLVGELVPGVLPLAAFPAPDSLYRHVAASVGTAPWGYVALTVGPDHAPRVMPLQVAFELRHVVEAAQAEAGLPIGRRHELCAMALAQALAQVRDAIDIATGLLLSLEIAFGMAKMVPMSRTAFAAAQREAAAH